MKLPTANDLSLDGKTVLVRADLDVNLKGDDYRLEVLIPTLEYLRDRKCKTILIGHKGRPDGKKNDELSLSPVSKHLERILINLWGEDRVKQNELYMMENLRFDLGEETNNKEYTKRLAENGEFYINEAFSNSHRAHSSIVGLPGLLPHAAGFHFIKEVENLSLLWEKQGIVFVGGAKRDKLNYIDGLKKVFSKVLIGGRLPEYLPEDVSDPQLVIARLIPDKEDITIHSIEQFEKEARAAKYIFLAGPMGKFEEEGHRLGTKRVFEAVANSNAVKIAGGGDTLGVISLLNLKEMFNWISVGGGAALEFLVKKTLPGIEALLK